MNEEANRLSLQPKPRESETTGPTVPGPAGDAPGARCNLPLVPTLWTPACTSAPETLQRLHLDGYKRQSPVSTEHCVGFSELYKVIRNPEASGLSSLLSGISGVHLRTLLGQP